MSVPIEIGILSDENFIAIKKEINDILSININIFNYKKTIRHIISTLLSISYCLNELKEKQDAIIETIKHLSIIDSLQQAQIDKIIEGFKK